MGTNPAKTLSDAPPATPGYLTTEFWKTAIYTVVSLLTGLGIIGPSVPDKYRQWLDVAAFIAPAFAIAGYSLSRGKTKAAAIEAAASVLMQDRHFKQIAGPAVTDGQV